MITDIKHGKMEHQWYGIKSWVGTILTFIFGFIGVENLTTWAIVATIITGFSTAVYTWVKIIKELNLENHPTCPECGSINTGDKYVNCLCCRTPGPTCWTAPHCYDCGHTGWGNSYGGLWYDPYSEKRDKD